MKSLSYNLTIDRVKYISIAVLTICIVILYLKHFYSFIFLALFTLFGLFLSIAFKDNSPQSSIKRPSFSDIRIPSIFFFLLISLLSLSLLWGINTKTTLFYVIIALCVFLLGLEIMYFPKKSRFILIKIYILCLIVFLSNQIVFPLGIGGADSYKHLTTIEGILEFGRILPEYVYSFNPTHHLLISISEILSDVNYRTLYYVTGSFLMSLNTLIVYLIGRVYISERTGLISALIYPFNDYILFWSSHSAQLTYLIPLMCFLYWAFFNRTKNLIGYNLIALILIISVIFCHHYSSIILIFLLLAFYINDIFLSKRYRLTGNNYTILFSFLLVSLFAHWIFYSDLIYKFSMITDKYLDTLIGLATSDYSYVTQSSYYDNLSLTFIFQNTIGTCLLLMLSSYGLFNLFNKNNRLKYLLTIWMLITASLIVLGIFFHFPWLLPNRIYVFLQLFCLTFLASHALNQLCNRANWALIILFLVMLSLAAFFSAASTIAGFETSLFKWDEPYIKLYEEPQELSAEGWTEYYIPSNIIMYPSKSIYPPNLYSAWFKKSIHYVEGLPIYNDNYTINISAIHYQSFILFSNNDMHIGIPYYKKISSWGGSGAGSKLSKDSYTRFCDSKKFNLIYDNKLIAVFCYY